MSSSKWIEIGDVGRSAAEVAAEILGQRMQSVEERLPLAVVEYHRDVEHVHQLRVGCRRAGAALQAFRPLLGGKAKRLRGWLQKIRQAAGPARDADVLLMRLNAEPKQLPGHEYVVTSLQQRRDSVQKSLRRIIKKAGKGRLEKSVNRCLLALQDLPAKKAAIDFDTYARQAMQASSQKVFRLAAVEQPTMAQLHRLRIAGKRLRYSMELFHSAFPDSLREEVYPIVEDIQSRLGQINDHATAQALFQSWLAHLPPDERASQLAGRIVAEHEQAKQLRANFLAWWTPKRIAAIESHLSSFF